MNFSFSGKSNAFGETKNETLNSESALFCSNCGKKLDADAKFCSGCGKQLSVQNTCKNCGRVLKDDENFCPGCGTKKEG